jgi:hypothetical protein
MARYDPLDAPDPVEWQSLSEQERMRLVLVHHRKADMELPNEQAHAAVHVVVENQVALGDQTLVPVTLERLIREGLDRHDAVHAIGSVLMDFVQELLNDDTASWLNEKYDAELRKLKARKWLESFR